MSAPISGARLESSSPAASPEGSLLDPAVLLAACGGSEALLKRVCDLLSRMLPVEMDRATLALREGKATDLRHLAHQLGGMLAAFSTVAAASATDLEEAAERQDLEAASEHLHRLIPMADEIIRLVGDLSVEALMRTDAQLRDGVP